LKPESRPGFEFMGFFDAPSDVNAKQYYKTDCTAVDELKWDKDTTAPTTLYAQWAATSKIVLVVGPNGSDAKWNSNDTCDFKTGSDSFSLTFGHELKDLTAACFPATYTGYIFTGIADQAGKKYYDKDGKAVIDPNTTKPLTWDKNIPNIVTLWAQWTVEATDVTIDYHFTGTVTEGDGNCKGTFAIKTAPRTGDDKYVQGLPTPELNLNAETDCDDVTAPTKADDTDSKDAVTARWEFNGFWSAASGGTQYYDEEGAVKTNGSTTDPKPIDWKEAGAKVVLHAQWLKKSEVKIVYQIPTGDGNEDGTWCVVDQVVSRVITELDVTTKDTDVDPQIDCTNAPEYTGFSLQGLYSTPSVGGVQYYTGGGNTGDKGIPQPIKEAVWPDGSANVTIYARWAQKDADSTSTS
jgi:hypothetical protein